MWGDDQEMRWQVLALYIELFQALDNGRLFERAWFAGRTGHEGIAFIVDGLVGLDITPRRWPKPDSIEKRRSRQRGQRCDRIVAEQCRWRCFRDVLPHDRFREPQFAQANQSERIYKFRWPHPASLKKRTQAMAPDDANKPSRRSLPSEWEPPDLYPDVPPRMK